MVIPLKDIIPATPVRHLLNGVSWQRDADGEGYGVAVALCRAQEDCTGSGKHSMVTRAADATCADCLSVDDEPLDFDSPGRGDADKCTLPASLAPGTKGDE